MSKMKLIAAALLALGGAAGPAAACGVDGPACAVPLGSYRIELPEGAAPQAGQPAVMFFHGWGGTAAQTLSNRGMVESFLSRGWAVIAPEGLGREGASGGSWAFHPDRPGARDEGDFAREVLADAAAVHAIDRERVMLSGFSIGGSLTWYLACDDPGLAAAYAPVAGAFWRPHPGMEACAGPVRLLHTHGWRDETVPLEGRPLRGGAILQGDVFHSLEILRATNGCDQMRADAYDTEGAYWRRWWTRCTPGSALEFALHEGGHSVPPDWAPMAIDWFERILPPAGKAG